MKVQNKIFPLMMIISILFFGCSKNIGSSFDMAQKESLTSNEPQELKVEEEKINVERKLIKEGNLAFETTDIAATRDLIFKSLGKYKAYVSSDKEHKSTRRISNTIVIRVPAKNFDLLVNDSTKGIDRFDSKNIEVKDVTEEFLDVQARLKTKRELEIRYLSLLDRAMNVSEILEIKKQAGELRSEIESIEGRLKYLENRVSFSTLTMSFYQPISSEIQFTNKFKDAAKKGWENLIWTFVFLTHIWPFLLIFFGALFGVRIWIKRRMSRRTNTPMAE